jgi:hypothetical protein
MTDRALLTTLHQTQSAFERQRGMTMGHEGQVGSLARSAPATAHFPPCATPGTPSAWVTPPPASLPRRLVLNGGFTVDDGHHRHLDQQASRLGFGDLRACLQAVLDDGWSIPQLATHLDTTQAAIRRAIADHHLGLPPRRQQLARQRQRAAQLRATARVAGLGFPGVRAYLVDRLVTQAWTLTQVQGELGAATTTVQRLLEQQQVQPLEPTRRRAAAGASPASPNARLDARTTTTTTTTTTTSRSSALNYRVEVLELDPGILSGEPPVHATPGSVASRLPRRDLPLQRCPVGQAAVQALLGQHGKLDLGHVQPAAVLGGVVQLQPVGQPLGLRRRERLVQ